MNEPITITATLPAWLPNFQPLDRMLSHLKAGNSNAVADMLTYTDNDMGTGRDPYALVGEATITVRLMPHDALTAARINSLQRELEAGRAEWMERQQQIMERISKLQALTNEVSA
jgi:hypothetical protein